MPVSRAERKRKHLVVCDTAFHVARLDLQGAQRVENVSCCVVGDLLVILCFSFELPDFDSVLNSCCGSVLLSTELTSANIVYLIGIG
jgi:hypothetical protein